MRFVLGVISNLVLLLSLSACQHSSKKTQNQILKTDSLEIIEFADLPNLEESKLKLGGFSGLTLESQSPGAWTFKTHTDRGPNLDPIPKKGSEKRLTRPFLLPEFQPRWVQFTYDLKAKSLRIDQQIFLTVDGRKMTGLPNKHDEERWDELPVDSHGRRLRFDLMGIDPEGLVRVEDGTYWMSEEYRPSLIRFSADGRLLARYVPEGSPRGTGQAILPAHYLRRRMNSGFEGVAAFNGKIYAFLQSSLSDEAGRTHILEIDSKMGSPGADFLYAFETVSEGLIPPTKIGDAVALPDGSFLVIEQNSEVGDQGFHSIYRIHLGPAGDFVQKTRVADLVALGLKTYSKIEGLTLVDRKTLALVTDNDFGVIRKENPAFVILHLAEPLF